MRRNQRVQEALEQLRESTKALRSEIDYHVFHLLPIVSQIEQDVAILLQETAPRSRQRKHEANR
jgi:hypothetical protein